MKILKDALENDFADLLKTIREKFGTDTDNNYLLWTDLTEQQLEALSCDYYFRSIYRRLTTFSEALYDQAPSAFLDNISEWIAYRLGDNFKRLFEAYFEGQYNPLHNYDMEEKRAPDLTTTTNGDTNSKVSTTTDRNQYGFDSTDPVPTDHDVSTTEADKTYNTTHAETTEKGSETTTRKGNIGVLSSQKLMIEELNLRQYDYWSQIYKMIDKLLVRGLF